MKNNLITSLALVLIILLPFTFSDRGDEINPEILSDSTVGFYQSTTCEISLIEFYLKNVNTSLDIYYNNNDYSDVRCFGKITGVDKIGTSFMVSIGTNTSLNFIIQTFIWLLLFLFIPKKGEKIRISLKYLSVTPVIFILQYFGENRFYEKTNILYSNQIQLDNFYLLSIFLFLVLITFISRDIFEKRINNIVNYLPFVFLIIGTYSGMNLNIYLIIFSIFGLNSIKGWASFSRVDLIYFSFSSIWLINSIESNYFFDGDKLRGFTNSSYNFISQLFWIVILYLLLKGLIFVVKESKEFISLGILTKNFLISGSLVVSLGILGSNLPIFNFLNYYIFGQNKRGMKEFSSVAGNTWRGFSSSAESIGEFFGLIILIVGFAVIFKENRIAKPYFFLLIPIIYGLYRSNNFAAMLSLLATVAICLVVKSKIYQKNKRNFILISAFIFLFTFLFFVLTNDYEYLSTELVYEATLHQDFYSDTNSYKSFVKIREKMIERDLNSILYNEENLQKASTAYISVVNIFTQQINVPFIPNFIAFISIVSLLINRTEMWGIFIAKFNPTTLETLFGTGPFQLNKYLYEHKIKLDLPEYRLQELFLPHSSLLDIIIFFGIFGFLLITCFTIYLYLYKKNNLLLKLTCFYLILNFLKSDSILYLNSFLLIATSFLVLYFRESSEVEDA